MKNLFSMRNINSMAGANAAACTVAHFCGYTYARIINVSTAVAVLIFILRLLSLIPNTFK